MSKKYEDYDYEIEESDKQIIIKRALIILLVLIAVIIIVYLLNGCSKKDDVTEEPKVVEKSKYENLLLEAAKKYLDLNEEETPKSIGECTKITLTVLKEKNLIETAKFNTCEGNNTFVNVCKLENGNIQYSPWISCQDEKSESKYAPLKEGNINEVKANETYVEFKYMPQQLKGGTLGEVEEAWNTDLKNVKYKTLETIETKYRYRDKLYIWNVNINHYYSSKGESTNPNDINEYYVTAPNNEYTNKDNATTAYRWYKKEYAMKNGSKDFSASKIGEYTNPDEVYKYAKGYSMPTSNSKTYKPIAYHVCENSAGIQIITPNPCNNRPNISQEEMNEFSIEKPMIYSCTGNQLDENNPKIKQNQVAGENSTCYEDWSYIKGTCTVGDNCKVVEIPIYTWYKKVYYKDNIYYTSSPSSEYNEHDKGVTAYKWYKVSTTTTTEYTATAPNVSCSSVTKSNKYKWSNWSEWSSKKESAPNGVDRSYDTKKKLKIQRIDENGEGNWENLSDNYVDLGTMLAIFTNKGYTATTLDDVNVNGEIRYQVKMYIRNKKEAK